MGEPADRARFRVHHLRLFAADGAEDELRAVAADLVARIRPAGRADLVEAVLRPLPMRTVLGRLGLDPGLADDLGAHAATARLLHGVVLDNGDQVRSAQAMAALWQACRAAVAAQPADGPLAGVGDVDDRTELVVQAVLSGPASTTALLGNALLRLLGTPDWDALAADPARLDGLVDDCLRHATPVVLWRREATKAVTVDGAALPAGARVLVHLGAANREPGPPLTFGSGAHACPGADLVRAHLRAVLATLAAQLPGLRREPGPAPALTREIGLHGPTELSVTWDRSATPVNVPAQR
ncbi:hypothetical protein BJF78_31505 [Pseudonocardia sp. CNS-139]|nr:hypothetical protein BJF78_31505 [Pseudonocardia sp. CNS-139]